jgi:hypothetical protein
MAIIALIMFAFMIVLNTPTQTNVTDIKQTTKPVTVTELAIKALEQIQIKGRAPKTDYSRDQFGAGWRTTMGCDTRNIILNRDLSNPVVDEKCNVLSGSLNDPYTGRFISFVRGASTSGDVQIDHVVALSDAWQKGAQQLTAEDRANLANDPLELLAVDGAANMQKSDGDAATWLPSNKPFRCQYVARQIAVKQKYSLWMTSAEHDKISDILSGCPNQLLPSP